MKYFFITLTALSLSKHVNPFSPLPCFTKIQRVQLSATPSTKEERPFFANKHIQNATEVADVERAWLLDSIEEVDKSKEENSSLVEMKILGPLFTVVLLVAFLLNTLMQSEGISDNFLSMDWSHKLAALQEVSWLPDTLTEAQLSVGFVMAFSAFAQALTGFGFAVVAVGAMSSMPWLLHSELYDVITPVAATLGSLVGFMLLLPCAYAEEGGLEWDEILPLLLPCTILTPLGIQLSNIIDPLVGTRVLAALIMGFVAYKLLPMIQDFSSEETDSSSVEEDSSAPAFLQTKAAAYICGSAAGIFGGAFDVQGPPLCVYGDAKGWTPSQFRNNVLTVVALNSAFVVAIDYYQGVLANSFYYSYFCLTSLPGVLIGLYLGQEASKRIDPVLFKNLVLVMCLGLGVQLLLVS